MQMVDEKVYRYDQVTKPDISNKQFEKYQKEFMAAESELMMTCQLLNLVVAKADFVSKFSGELSMELTKKELTASEMVVHLTKKLMEEVKVLERAGDQYLKDREDALKETDRLAKFLGLARREVRT